MKSIGTKVSALALVCLALGCQQRGFNNSDVKHGSFGSTPTPEPTPTPTPKVAVDFGPRNKAVAQLKVSNHCLQQTAANLELKGVNKAINLPKTAQSSLSVDLKAGEDTERPTVMVNYNSVVTDSSKGEIRVAIEGNGTTFTPENKSASWEAVVANEGGSIVLNPLKSGDMKITLRPIIVSGESQMVIASVCEANVDRDGDVTCNASKYNVLNRACN